jgi:hypothetical protein
MDGGRSGLEGEDGLARTSSGTHVTDAPADPNAPAAANPRRGGGASSAGAAGGGGGGGGGAGFGDDDEWGGPAPEDFDDWPDAPLMMRPHGASPDQVGGGCGCVRLMVGAPLLVTSPFKPTTRNTHTQ